MQSGLHTSKAVSRRSLTDKQRATIARWYRADASRSIREASRTFEISCDTVRRILDEHGIKIRRDAVTEKRLRNVRILDLIQKHSFRVVASHFGISRQRVQQIVKRAEEAEAHG